MCSGEALEPEQVETVFKDCMPEENDDGEIKYARKYQSHFAWLSSVFDYRKDSIWILCFYMFYHDYFFLSIKYYVFCVNNSKFEIKLDLKKLSIDIMRIMNPKVFCFWIFISNYFIEYFLSSFFIQYMIRVLCDVLIYVQIAETVSPSTFQLHFMYFCK